MAKKLRVLTDPDFTTKGSPLTKEEADQDLIDIWDATLDGKGVTATATELNRLDGDLATVRSNLGLGSSDAVTFATVNTGHGNNELYPMDQGVRTTDSVTHAAGTFTGVLKKTIGTEGGLPEADTRIDAQTFSNAVNPAASRMLWDTLSAGGVEQDGSIMFWGGPEGSGTRSHLLLSASQHLSRPTDQTLPTGWQIDINGRTDMVTFAGSATVNNDLFVKGGLFAQEFVVEQTRLFSEQIIGPMGAKIESVSGSAGSETITLSDEYGAGNPFVAGAFIRIQSRTGQSSGTILKQIFRKVSSVSGMTATLTTTGVNDTDGTTYSTTDDVGSIAAGDHAVGWGHATDATLDHYIHFDVANVAIPAIRFFDEVTNFDAGFEALRVGGMSGFDASITGDIGIAGATKSDGAVFWVTEDQAKLSRFTFNSQYMTDNNVWIGNNLLDGTVGVDGTNRLLMGNAFDGTLPFIKVTGGSGDFIQFFGRDNNDFFQIYHNNNKVVGVGPSEARFFGAYVDNTDLWGYKSGYTGSTSDKTNASVRLDFAEGRILYDAMGGSLSAKLLEANFGTNNEVASIVDNEWIAEVSANGTNTIAEQNTILRGRYKHKFGLAEMQLQAQVKKTLTVSSGLYSDTNEIRFRVLDSESGTVLGTQTHSITNTTYSTVTISLDISSTGANLTPGNYYVIEVIGYVQVSGDASNTSTDSGTGRTYLQEDYFIDVGTG